MSIEVLPDAEHKDMSLLEIYNALLAGKTVTIAFERLEDIEIEVFRVKVYRFKTAQDTLGLELGLLEQSEIMSLRFQINAKVVTMKLVPKTQKVTYAVVIS